MPKGVEMVHELCRGIHSVSVNPGRTKLAIGLGKPFEVVVFDITPVDEGHPKHMDKAKTEEPDVASWYPSLVPRCFLSVLYSHPIIPINP